MTRAAAASPGPGEAVREAVSMRFIWGSGVEVGALHRAFPVSQDAKVTYVDRMTKDQALTHYPELLPARDGMIEPDVIDDGETLAQFPDASQDFVIASHFLEHCENPLRTVRNQLRVLRPGGRLLLVVPNAKDPAGWDHERELTTFDHLVRDDREGPHVSRDTHYWEWVTIVDKLAGEAAAREHARIVGMQYSIHFHCWTPATFLPFLVDALRYHSLDAIVAHYDAGPGEMIAVLARPGTGDAVPARVTPGAAGSSDGSDVRVELEKLRADRERLETQLHDVTTELEALRTSATFRLREHALRSRMLSRPTRFLARVNRVLFR